MTNVKTVIYRWFTTDSAIFENGIQTPECDIGKSWNGRASSTSASFIHICDDPSIHPFRTNKCSAKPEHYWNIIVQITRYYQTFYFTPFICLPLVGEKNGMRQLCFSYYFSNIHTAAFFFFFYRRVNNHKLFAEHTSLCLLFIMVFVRSFLNIIFRLSGLWRLRVPNANISSENAKSKFTLFQQSMIISLMLHFGREFAQKKVFSPNPLQSPRLWFAPAKCAFGHGGERREKLSYLIRFWLRNHRRNAR